MGWALDAKNNSIDRIFSKKKNPVELQWIQRILESIVKPETTNLTGKLLLAHPALRDPNFRHSIVYLTKHDVLTGALGFIINRPIAQTFKDLGLSEISPLLGQAKLHLGGPVATDNILLAMFEWDALTRKLTMHHSTKNSSEELELLDPTRTIALIGYAGWTEGQLEEEITQNTWLILDSEDVQEDLLHADDSTWKKLVSRIDPRLRLLAEMPADPSLN